MDAEAARQTGNLTQGKGAHRRIAGRRPDGFGKGASGFRNAAGRRFAPRTRRGSPPRFRRFRRAFGRGSAGGFPPKAGPRLPAARKQGQMLEIRGEIS